MQEQTWAYDDAFESAGSTLKSDYGDVPGQEGTVVAQTVTGVINRLDRDIPGTGGTACCHKILDCARGLRGRFEPCVASSIFHAELAVVICKHGLHMRGQRCGQRLVVGR